jgi:hypothetical protein
MDYLDKPAAKLRAIEVTARQHRCFGYLSQPIRVLI